MTHAIARKARHRELTRLFLLARTYAHKRDLLSAGKRGDHADQIARCNNYRRLARLLLVRYTALLKVQAERRIA